MSALFSSFKLRELVFKNRVFVSPMCQYSCVDGVVNDWHLVHLGSRAVGGAAMVMTEAAAVSAQGRISPEDAGMWCDAHVAAWKPIAAFIKAQGSVPAIQLAHAGRKASCFAPWRSGLVYPNGHGKVPDDQGGWSVIGPSDTAFSPTYPQPHVMTLADIQQTVADFVTATKRSLEAGFEVVEVHAAHGYLLHEFLSPASNLRTDDYGGSLENRMRFPLEVCRAVRQNWPAHLPVMVRISASDWREDALTIGDSIILCKVLKMLGIDLIDVSSGGNIADVKIPLSPGYQVPFATTIKNGAGIAVGAVGLITQPIQAEQIVATGLADAVFLARELLRNPYWPLHAAQALGDVADWPNQYKRAQVSAVGK
jgi:2,4-dienoyl-CoA reductase-like NADH-dependent reductase (Old Yellow Enzyme family)